jgi:hypothetical protein
MLTAANSKGVTMATGNVFKSYSSSALLRVIWPLLALMVCARLWPHPPNMTPCLAYALCGAQYMRRRHVWLSLLAVMLGTDLMLAVMHGHQAFGAWTLFTYSAWLAVVCVSSKWQLGVRAQGIGLVSVSVLFWCWSNFGVWLFSGMYAHTLAGLLVDYTNAIPFLASQMLGDMVWFVVIYGYLAYASRNMGFDEKSANGMSAGSIYHG